MTRLIKPVTITEPVRIDTARSIVVTERLKSGTWCSYELYGISHSNNKLKVSRLEYACTSADFAPMRSKSRIKYYLGVFDMVVEYREAWGKSAEKVIVYESEFEAKSRDSKPSL